MKQIMKKSAALVLTAALAFGPAPAAVGTIVPSMSLAASAATVTRSVNSWDGIIQAIKDIGQSGTASITLSSDITAPANADPIVIPDGAFVTISLNGHTLSRGLTSPTENGYVIKIANGGELSISGGTITGGNNTRVVKDIPDPETGEPVETVISSGNGGAIFGDYNSCLWMSGVKIKSNYATNGGGVWFNTQANKSEKVNSSIGKTMLSISNCTFEYNMADEVGGALFLANSGSSNSDLHFISSSTFNANSATNGGAMALSNANYLNVTGSYFKSNTASDKGGAIYSPVGSFICSLNDTTIQSNSAKNGGGIYSSGSTINIWNKTYLKNNSAIENGGGLYLDGASAQLGWSSDTSTSASNTGFIMNNTAKNGGGVYVSEKSTMSLQWGDVKNNTASNGGNGAGIYNLGTIVMQNGASSVDPKPLTVLNNTTTATKDGITLNLPSNIYVSGSGSIDNSKLYQKDATVAAGVMVDPSILKTHPKLNNAEYAEILSKDPSSDYSLVTDDDSYLFGEMGTIIYVNHVKAGAGYGTGTFADTHSKFKSVCTSYEVDTGFYYITTAAKTNVGGSNYYAVWSDGDVRYKQEGTAETTTSFAGSNVVVGGDVKLNFYVTLSDADVKNLSNLKMNFTWRANNNVETATSKLVKSGNNYVASVSLNPAELSADVTATLDGTADGSTYTKTDSISTYLRTFIATGNGDNLAGLSCALADYSTYLQDIFTVNVNSLTNSGVSDASRQNLYGTIDSTVETSDIDGFKQGDYAHSDATLSKFSSDDMKYVGSSLLFLNKTTLRHYFEVKDGKTAPDITVTVGTTKKTIKANKSTKVSNWVYYDIEDISIETWGNDISMTVGSDTTAYYYCPLDYAIAVLSNAVDTSKAKQDLGEKSDSYIKLAKAMHYCYKYAKAYAQESN